MSKRLFDFLCDEGHVTEALREDSTRTIECPHCGKDAVTLYPWHGGLA